MISLIQLEYIVAVDTYRHYVTAAEKCFVTQPTLSMQIKKMEEDLGVTIFDRSKQPIVPTELGEKIIEQARITLSESKKINEVIAEFNNDLEGTISIGIIPSLAPYLLPLFIGNFTRKFPKIRVKITELLTEEIIKELKKDSLDVGLLVTPIHEKGIFERVLFYEEMKLYVNKNHDFAQNTAVEVGEINSPDLWLLNQGHCFRSQVINLCSYKIAHKEDMPFDYASGSLETIKKLVEIEGGFTILPELAIENKALAVSKSFHSTTPLREVSLVYSRNYTKKRLLQLLEEEIKSSVPPVLLNKKRGQLVEWK